MAGPLARSVPDMALMLDAMAAADENDARTLDPEAMRPETYTASLNADGLEGKRIGVLRSFGAGQADNNGFSTFFNSDDEDFGLFNQALADLERLGATLVDNVHLDNLNTNRSGGGDFARDIAIFFDGVDSPIDSFEELCLNGSYSLFAYESSERCLSFYSWAESNGTPSSTFYQGVKARYAGNRDYTEALMQRLNLDALIFPADTYGAASVTSADSSCTVNSVSGMPTMTFPVGYSSHAKPMPVGMVILGRKFDEPTLLEIAYAYEQGTGHRQGPVIPTALGERDLPPMDLEAANAMRLRLGEEAYNRYLKDGAKFSLNGDRFKTITEDVLEEAGRTDLLP